ncbi:MAG: c-type cytochrome [Deltaproteobacteria bacterium]|nr:c-type cytochrome [Deltaproteobacteria bacterium]
MTQKELKYGGHAKVYIKVWLTLLCLTVMTVAVSYYNFGDWNIFVAMLVATIKAVLVCLFFMHLKYDNRLNQVVFVSSLLFLAIFVGLTASDEWDRETYKPVKVTDTASAALSTADINKMREGGPEVLAKGKEIFAVQCAACHGVSGKGDGAAAVALNPKPRDFTSGVWRFGGAPTHVFNTITKGSPGTGMAGFSSLSVADRWALVAFVRSLAPNPPADTPEDLKTAGLDKEEQGSGAIDPDLRGAGQGPKTNQPIPVRFAIKELAQKEFGVVDTTSLPTTEEGNDVGVGQKIYQQNCLSCHGVHGKGGIPVSVVSVNPFVYLKTEDFSQARGGWAGDRSQFVKVVSNGIPGRGMAGFSGFTDAEWDALWQYVVSLGRK